MCIRDSSRPISTEYPGNGGRALTDGVRTQIFDTQSWVGFNGREPVTLTFDLGEVVDGLADFEVGAFEERDYGIGLPAAVAVSVSTDGENFSWIGSVLAPAEVSGTEAYPFKMCIRDRSGSAFRLMKKGGGEADGRAPPEDAPAA